MIDAVGLQRNLGCIALLFSLCAACLALVSAMRANDAPRTTTQTFTLRAKICPPYSKLALVASSTSLVLGLLGIWAYATKRPDTPEHFLRGTGLSTVAMWHLGEGFWMMVGGLLSMLMAFLFLVAVRHSKRFFRGESHEGPAEDKHGFVKLGATPEPDRKSGVFELDDGTSLSLLDNTSDPDAAELKSVL